MNAQTVSQGDDREVMATRVEAIVTAMGARCVRVLGDGRAPPCFWLRIAAPGGLNARLSLNGEAGRLHFLHWDICSDSRNRLRPGFGGVNGGNFSRATHVAYSFEALCERLEDGLRLADSGEAFQAPPMPS